MKKFILITGMAMLIILPASLSALPLVNIEAAVGVWRQSPAGYVSYQSDDRLTLEDVLNYDAETRFFGRLKIDMPVLMPDIYLAASPLKFEETATVDDFYKFGNIIILPGIQFKSRLVVNQYDIGLYYEIPLLEKATLKKLRLEAGLNTKILDARATVTQKTIPEPEIKETKKETAVVPMGYLGIYLCPADRFAIAGEFRGISYGDSDFYSLIGRLRINTYGPHFIAGGYRYDTGKFHEGGLEFDVDFSGPFVETGFRF